MSTLQLFLALFSAPAMAKSTGADQDGPIAWACTYEWSERNITLSLARYLSDKGRQKEISGDWEIVGSSKLRLSGLLYSQAGDPDVRASMADIGWLYQDYDKDFGSDAEVSVRAGPTIAGKWLHARGAELTMPWIKVKELTRNGRINARLVGGSGQALSSGFIDMRDVRLAETQVQRALASTRRDARDFKQRCVRFNPLPAVPR